MRCTIPEISWHNRDPVLSIDIQPQLPNEDFYRLASGGTDSHVIIWHLRANDEGIVSIDAAADLVRHQKAVNAVRFSPCRKFLASGDDESVIMIWKQRQDTDAPDLSGPGDTEVVNKEAWVALKVLRGHLEDVYDLCWSPDSTSIISGSVDNTAIVWDVQKGTKAFLHDHKGFVQGVAWDPKGQFVATLSSDRKLRVFNATSKKLVARVGKSPLPVPKGHELEGKNINLFHDDTIQTFFRRLCFSPDGEMIIAPSGVIEATEPGKKPSSTTLVFSRRLLSRPVCFLPSLDEYSVCVRCCPVLFELRNIDPSTKPESMFLLPYRVVFAVATACAVVLYDTQQPMPFGYISNLHYTRLTDMAWSPKGEMLMVSSTDGYCSIITFSPEELGVEYNPKSSGASTVSSKEVKEPSEVTDKGQPSVLNCDDDLEKEVSNSSDGVACIQLSQDVISETPSNRSDLGLFQLKDEDTETNSNVCQSPKSPKTEKTSESSGIGCDPGLHKLRDEEELAISNVCNTPKPSKEEEQPDNLQNSEAASNESCASSSQSQIPDVNSKTFMKTVTEGEKDIPKTPQSQPAEQPVTPSDSGKKVRRVQLITLSSPKSRKKLL